MKSRIAGLALEFLRRFRSKRLCRSGLELCHAGRFREAREQFDKVVSIDPEHVSGYYYRAICHTELNNHLAAIEDYGKDLVLRPNLANAYYGRGHSLLKLGNHIEAVDDFDKALDIEISIEFEAEDAEAYYRRAIESYEERDCRKSLTDLDRAVIIRPHHAGTYLLRGVCHSFVGSYVEGKRMTMSRGHLRLTHPLNSSLSVQKRICSGDCPARKQVDIGVP